ncbi:MAG: hypothetical protein V1659_02545 [Candidatus Woesearchaeota archaeon]
MAYSLGEEKDLRLVQLAGSLAVQYGLIHTAHLRRIGKRDGLLDCVVDIPNAKGRIVRSALYVNRDLENPGIAYPQTTESFVSAANIAVLAAGSMARAGFQVLKMGTSPGIVHFVSSDGLPSSCSGKERRISEYVAVLMTAIGDAKRQMCSPNALQELLNTYGINLVPR